jgi:D-alanyl-D-alanine carboxypeptidase (penicillin-binding protein 5/6)
VDYGVPPEVKSGAAILIDRTTGQVLYEKNADVQSYPASTTKIMTALLAIEHLPLEQIVTMDTEVSGTPESKIYLLNGEEMSVQDLLFALMLPSANDAAVALAKTISGSVPDFAAAMNAKAQALGTTQTNFVNPNGLPDPAHVTTARDLAIITQEAMKNEVFRQFVSTKEYVIPRTNRSWERRLTNRNQILFDYPGATGVKTGTLTDRKSLVASANRDGRELIVVILDADPWNNDVNVDAAALLDYGFYGFTDVSIFSPDVCKTSIAVTKGQSETLGLVAANPIVRTMPAANATQITYVYELPDSVKAPIEPGQSVGKVKAMLGETQIAESDLVAEKGVAKTLNLFERIGINTEAVSIITKIIVGSVLAILILFVVVFVRGQMDRRNRRTKKMRWGKTYASEIKRVRRIK